MRVKFFYAGGCSKCAAVRDALCEAAQSAFQVEWKEVDIAKDPHRAVQLGVLSTPALAIDGELLFSTAPTASELQEAILAKARSR